MKRIGLLFILLAFGSTNAHSGIIDIITGADMAGMEVTATFTDGSQETATWVTLTDPQPRPESIPANIALFEVYSGEAAGTGWSLYQQGETFGEFDGADFFGEWVVTNRTGVAMTSIVIDAVAGSTVFDNIISTVGTPGSNIGRAFVAPDLSEVAGDYSDPFSAPDLFGTLTVSWVNGLADGAEQRFLADTDRITATVPVPGTVLLMLLGGLGLSMRMRSARG